MGIKYGVFVVCLLALIHGGALQQTKKTMSKVFVDEVTTCCQYAFMEVHKQSNPDCNLIARRAPDVLNISGLICGISVKVCCMKQIQEKMCTKGENTAKEGNSCDRGSRSGNADHLECCSCCYLGMEAKKRGMSCTKSLLGFPCQKAFFSCCLSSEPPPTVFPSFFRTDPSTTPPSTTPPSTTPRTTCANLRCSHNCAVIRSEPQCVCRQGYHLRSDGRTCDDVNECLQQDRCSSTQKCVNTIGSYRCNQNPTLTCPNGFRVNPRQKSQCQDINECVERRPCRGNEDCENLQGSHKCKAKCPSSFIWRNGRCEKRCGTGFRWTGSRCEDINECLQNLCKDKICKNTPGSYRCLQKTNCRLGYQLVRGRCEDVDECVKYNPCPPNQECKNIPATYRCITKCPRGFKIVGSGCQDIDECLKNLCRGNKVCQNTPGSYRCVRRPRCRSGFQLVGSQCEDVDECVKYRPCSGGKECKNLPGTYRCLTICLKGYERVGLSCQDVNECVKNRPCSSDKECVNAPGSYQCVTKCSEGYKRVGSNCQDVNECVKNPPCLADKECVNVPGSYRCITKCSNGYERVGSDCQDIDECKRRPCKENEECQNTRGGYLCIKKLKCQSGYRFVPNRCEDIDECLDPDICSSRQKCKNTPGSYSCVDPQCRKGYEIGSDGRCKDIDECSKGTHNCKSESEKCVNSWGSFACQCKPGFRYSSKTKHCGDINECSEFHRCSQKCINTFGSYKCNCSEGYTLENRRCHDIDECKINNGQCEHECINNRGSFRCRCRFGFKVDSNNIKSCADIDECRTASCAWRCENTVGSYGCKCPKGYTSPYYWKNGCINIDECENDRNLCGRNHICIDTKGHYECLNTACPNSHFLKRGISHCAKKFCGNDDTSCNDEKRRSIRWYGQSFPNNAAARSFQYTYRITVTGYRQAPTIRFNLKGNSEGVFIVRSTGYGKCLLQNSRKLVGPKKFELELVGDVVYKGKVQSSFVTYVYVYVSQYDFN